MIIWEVNSENCIYKASRQLHNIIHTTNIHARMQTHNSEVTVPQHSHSIAGDYEDNDSQSVGILATRTITISSAKQGWAIKL